MNDASLGIIGDGQLARMLGEAARKMGLNVTVFAEDAAHPAARIALPTVLGSPKSLDALRQFVSKMDIIVFENEFVDCDLLTRASSGAKVTFLPSLANIALFQDKLKQKEKLKELSIPTSSFMAWDEKEDPTLWVNAAFDQLGSCVFKWSRLGYDGKGVFIARDRASDLTAILGFITEARKKGVQIYAEQKIDFRRELAIVSTLSTLGEFVSYPLVISKQENGICRQVLGPATSFGVPTHLQELATQYAHRLGTSCGLFGTFAIELFETADGDLLVNEIAPRVHNSGHYTQDAAETSQFENHWRGVLGLPLGPAKTSPAFFMWNVLGPDDTGPVKDSPEARPKALAPLRLHWYEKEEIRPRRKLGHINASAASPDEIDKLINEILRVDREWVLSLKTL
ncbi:MAG TPA: 5-(carboxyamino)imidazole ribonucleotide synthase [Bdellovibrionales bacterium]|nr:5-(carboxyamino)imidazole ribonucleotide synthase [Bdellovibrionales bacterium]